MAPPDTLPVKEFRRLDLNSEEMGVPVRRLMDNAGRALAEAVQGMLPDGEVVLLCGKGNNGGDGYAAAAHLLEAGLVTRCVVVEEPTGPDSRHYRDALPEGLVEPWRAFKDRRKDKAGLVVDCLIGSGIRGEPRPPYDAAIRWINRQRAPVVSCDIPSGLGSSCAVTPDATVTFHAAKQGMTRHNSGAIHVADIGIPRRAEREVGFGDLKVGYPVPAPDSTKGQNGRVLLVGGGPFAGAPHYAGIAAYRTGADLVLAHIPKKAADVVRTWGPDLLVHDAGTDHLTPADLDGILTALGRASVLLVGPGLGDAPDTREAVRTLLDAAARERKPVVIDADGLDAVTPEYLRRNGVRTVLTPHAQEFRDLTGLEPSRQNVEKYAARHGVTVLRKGAEDVVSDGERRRHCRRGHPAMTVGGTGDVLAGCVAALLGKGAEPFDAACAAAYLVGVAGELAAQMWSYGATATDVAHAVPAVLRRLDG